MVMWKETEPEIEGVNKGKSFLKKKRKGSKCCPQEVKKRKRNAAKSKKADTQEVVFALHCTLRRKDGKNPRFVVIGVEEREGLVFAK
jgi:hypothetical protein